MIQVLIRCILTVVIGILLIVYRDAVLPFIVQCLGVAFVSRNWKIAIAPVVLMLILFIFVPALNAGTVGIMVPVSVLFTIGVSRILYKRGVL
mgnify:CR=1 FL=1